MPRAVRWTGYAVYNPPFRVADRLLRDDDGGRRRQFQQLLRANTGLTGEVEASPASVDLVRPASDEGLVPGRPMIFLFVIDSLRTRLPKPYNREVDVTPSLARLGRKTRVKHHVHRRLGVRAVGARHGSGRSGPQAVREAICSDERAGKRLDANGLGSFSRESIIGQDSAANVVDDGDRCRPAQRRLCIGGTVRRARAQLEATADDDGRCLDYSLPPGPSCSNIIGAKSPPPPPPPPRESYPASTRRRRARPPHRGFGDFIPRGFLKRHACYDRQIIVVDRGPREMLGEEVVGEVTYLHPPVVECRCRASGPRR